MLNMLTADILTLFIPGAVDEVVEIAAETSIPVSRSMLFGAIMIEIPILMKIFFADLTAFDQSLVEHCRKHNYHFVCRRTRNWQ